MKYLKNSCNIHFTQSSPNHSFNLGIMSPSTGIIFNGQMGDLTTDPETPNAYGVPPSRYNLIRPGARPASSMSPTIITDRDGNVLLVIGASGGPSIVSSVASVSSKAILSFCV